MSTRRSVKQKTRTLFLPGLRGLGSDRRLGRREGNDEKSPQEPCVVQDWPDTERGRLSLGGSVRKRFNLAQLQTDVTLINLARPLRDRKR